MIKYRIDSRNVDFYKTFACGQCFRWYVIQSWWATSVDGSVVNLWEEHPGMAYLIDSNNHSVEWWYDYFDLKTDYSELSSLNLSDFERRALEYGKGIKILKQDLWEVMVSFITSQQNNIGRICKLLESLSVNYGEHLMEFERKCCYGFPSPEVLAEVGESRLRDLGFGYRASYIDYAAKHFNIDFKKQLLAANKLDALYLLKQFPGIGDKVANCISLFGLHHLDSFPIDVWIKKVMFKYPEVQPEKYGRLAGVMQQYIYYYSRSGLG